VAGSVALRRASARGRLQVKLEDSMEVEVQRLRISRVRVTKASTRALAVLVALLVAAGSALAHDTWLLPSSLRVPVGQAVTLSLTSGMTFPVNLFVIEPSRVKRADVQLAGKTSALGAGRRSARVLRYSWTPAQAGVAALAVELAPKTLTLTPDKITEYLEEIDASASVRNAWAQIPAPKRWRESYVKHASTFIRVGNPGADSSWARPLGLGLEIVPERDPTLLTAGDTLPVRVLRGGSPLAGFVVGARHAGATKATFFPTDAAGRARITLPSSGQWLLAGTDLRRTSRPNLEWESDFTTMTLAVVAK
jgi:uncharacterized GH25 family protein